MGMFYLLEVMLNISPDYNAFRTGVPATVCNMKMLIYVFKCLASSLS